jgi:hypothetical protein
MRSTEEPAARNLPVVLELAERAERAARDGSQASILDDDARRHREAILAYMMGAWELRHRGSLTRAVERFASALRAAPEWDWIAWNLEDAGRQAARSGRVEILDQILEVLRSAPRYRHTADYLAACKAVMHQDFSTARDLVKKAMDASPQHPPALELLRVIDRQIGPNGSP